MNFRAIKVYADDQFLAFMDIQPVNKGHVLIVPKQHRTLMAELDDAALGSLFPLANRINQAIRNSEIRPEGLSLLLADGEAAGQEVFHVHLHLIPRFRKDGFGFVFPADYKKKTPRATLDAVSQEIQAHLE